VDAIVTISRSLDVVIALAGMSSSSTCEECLGAGSDNPSPTACIVVGEQVVGWVDYDHDPDHDWLGDGEVNIGYLVFAEHRHKGCATRAAVELLLNYLARDTQYTTATLLIDPANEESLAMAQRCGFRQAGRPARPGVLHATDHLRQPARGRRSRQGLQTTSW
jgi:Acetyltransferase (GNAT) domain